MCTDKMDHIVFRAERKAERKALFQKNECLHDRAITSQHKDAPCK